MNTRSQVGAGAKLLIAVKCTKIYRFERHIPGGERANHPEPILGIAA